MDTQNSGGRGSRLTKRVIDAADHSRGRHTLWDGELRGFGAQIEASGTVTYFVRYRPKGLGADGPRRFMRIGRHGVITVEQARERAKEILGSVAAGKDPAAELKEARSEFMQKRDALTIAELATKFLDEHVDKKRKPRTKSVYQSLLQKHVYPNFGRMVATELKRADLIKFHASLSSQPHTANRVLAVLGSMFAFGRLAQLVPDGTNPVRGIEKYREQGREKYLSNAELKRLGEALTVAETVGVPWQSKPGVKSKHIPKRWKEQREIVDARAVAAIRMLLLTGARLREILNLSWGEVDLERGLLFLADSKTGKKAVVLSDAASLILQAQMTSRGSRTYVFGSAESDLPRRDLKRPWAAIKRAANLDGLRLHDLRHTFASIGAGASLGLPVVGKLLGHTQAQTTARYAHVDADPLRRATNIIGEKIEAAMS